MGRPLRAEGLKMEPLPPTLPDEPHRRFVDVLGCRLSYWEQGAGPALVLLHGGLDDAEGFRMLAEALAPRLRVIALELPGSGQSGLPPDGRYGLASTARYLGAALEELGVSRAVVAGHERGGALALFLGERDPQRVRAVVLLGASFWRGWAWLWMLRPPLRWVAPGAVQRLAVRRALRARYWQRPPFLADRAARLLSRVSMGAQRQLREQRDPAEEERLLLGLPGLARPLLVLRGARDSFSSASDAEALAGLCKQGEAREVPACGHSPHEERPAAVAELLVRWMDGVEGAALAEV